MSAGLMSGVMAGSGAWTAGAEGLPPATALGSRWETAP